MAEENAKIYALVTSIPEQMEIIEDICFGRCKMLIIGAIMDEYAGLLQPCKTPKEECMAFDKEMAEPFGTVDGEEVYLRKLKRPAAQ